MNREKANRSVIAVGRPRIVRNDRVARLSASVDIAGRKTEIWFEVDSAYGAYLCDERADAFLAGLLHYAMLHGHDLELEAPVTAQLLFQVRAWLIPTLTKFDSRLRAPTIRAIAAEAPIPNAGAVGTGISCGVDSFHVVCNHLSPRETGPKLTHAVLNNVGAFGANGEAQRKWQIENARRFCEEIGLPLIVTDSNIFDVLCQDHGHTHGYTGTFAVYCLQKLFGTYLYGSSGLDLGSFTVRKAARSDSGGYELMLFDCFSTRNLKIYSEGAAKTRFEKLRQVVGYEPSERYLHVCIAKSGGNCGSCGKCRRTLTALDALGALDRYAAVFDVAAYRAKRKSHLRWLVWQQLDRQGAQLTKETYALLKSDIPMTERIGLRLVHALYRAFWLTQDKKDFLKASFPALFRIYRKLFPVA